MGKKRGWKTNKLTTIITALTTIIGSDEVEGEKSRRTTDLVGLHNRRT